MNRVNPVDVRILVVDDDPEVLHGTARLLEKEGYAVDRAADGKEALRSVAAHHPGLVLLDHSLPGIDGLEVCRRIKRDAALADILVIIASGKKIETGDQAEGLEAGADGYITRPIANRELLARMEAYARIVTLTGTLRRHSEELKQTAAAALQAQSASLNLMEDAVDSQKRIEEANRELRREIVERKQAEAELEQQVRLASALLELPPMAELMEEKAFMQRGQEFAEDLTGSPISFIHFVNADQTTIELVTWSRRTLQHYCHATHDAHYPVSQAGIWADALREKRPVIFNDYATYAAKHGLPEGHAELRRLCSVPVIESGRVVMITGVGNKETDYTEREIKAVQLIGESVWRIVQRRRTDAYLRASEQRYRLLFEDNPLPMWLHDDETLAFLAVNATAVRAYGYSREEFLRLTIKQIVATEDVPALLGSLEHPDSTRPADGEWRHRRKDGSIIHAEVVSRPLVFDGRKAHLALAADITEKKLLEDKFLHAQRLESVGMLAAGIAHDLNNVLAPIMFAAPMLREKLAAPRDLKILDTLEQCAERGTGLVKQILGFVRTTSSELRPTQVKHIARDIISLMEETFPKAIELEHQVPSNPWTVEGNATQIHQVLINLCVNARDAMPEGGTLRLVLANRQLDEVEAAAIPGARPGAWLMLEVGDTGRGIPPGVLEQIWTPFFTTKGPDRGTGLGLTTVRSIVLGHHGLIELQTEEGKGTTFRIYLPAIEITSRKISDGAAASAPEGHGELILVVEDDVTIRNFVAAMLENHGYRTLLCTDGVDGVAQFTTQPDAVSLVITDVDMPRLGGLGLAQALRRTHPGLRIVAMSGLSHSEGGVSDLPSIQSLAQAILHKPFTADELLGTVHRVLQATETI